MKLEDGEVICSRCEGRGNIKNEGNSYLHYTSCPKCHGEKKLDWISNAMGELPTPKYSHGNILIGYQAGHNITTGSNNVCIGYKAGYHLTTETDQVHIGDNSENKT